MTPNPLGLSFTDFGLGDFLRSSSSVGAINPNGFWAKQAAKNDGKFQTATTRDVDKRPNPSFVKAYFHNGFMKSLKEVVHFYNTRGVLAKCPANSMPDSPGVGTTCWPAPEVAQNLEQRVGNLGLSEQEEILIVDFLRTLSDGYSTTPQ